MAVSICRPHLSWPPVALRLAERGIELLNPVFDLDFGQEAMASAMLGLGKQLGIPNCGVCLP